MTKKKNPKLDTPEQLKEIKKEPKELTDKQNTLVQSFVNLTNLQDLVSKYQTLTRSEYFRASNAEFTLLNSQFARGHAFINYSIEQVGNQMLDEDDNESFLDKDVKEHVTKIIGGSVEWIADYEAELARIKAEEKVEDAS